MNLLLITYNLLLSILITLKFKNYNFKNFLLLCIIQYFLSYLLFIKSNSIYIIYIYSTLISILIFLSIYDIKYKLVPPKIHILLIFIGIINIFFNYYNFSSYLYGAFIISIPLYLISVIKPNSFGGGDIKLYFSCGFILGYKLILSSFIVTIISSAIYCIIILIFKNKNLKSQIPFVPFISIGIFTSMLYCDKIIKFLLFY